MSFEAVLMWSLAIGGAIAVGMLVIALRGGEPSAVARATAAGSFVEALGAAEREPPRSRDDLLAAAIAARHRGEFERARGWLDQAIALDRTDGEVLIELGLLDAYRGRASEADQRLRDAMVARADLAESITLHRAFAALAGGDHAHAARLFEEVEAPLTTKLTLDVGPGDPAFAEWFLQAAALWGDAGASERADWAWRKAVESAPESLLPEHVRSMLER